MGRIIGTAVLLASAVWLGLAAGGCASSAGWAETKDIVWACTIGPIDAGIVDALEQAYQAKTGVVVRHVGAGTGQALKIGETGAVDLVMTHARALEDKFVADGFGTKRYDLMYNDFVIMGPPDDPVGIRGMKSATEAFKRIAEKGALFISRGDNSGTHVKEKEVWEAAAVKPQGSWYRVFERGAEGNTATLLYTDEQKAYTIIDRATYITTKNKISLQVLVEKDEVLLNYISVLPVNPGKHPKVNAKGAEAFVNWLVSTEGQKIIKEFGKDKYGEPLFFPNSEEGKRL